MIPTADVLPRGTASLEVEHLGAAVLPGDEGETFALSQVGLTSRLEAGVDRRIGGGPGHTFLNAKWQVTPQARGLPAVAIGVQTLAGGHRSEPYLVGTRGLGRTRLHLGALNCPDTVRALAGIVHTVSTVALQADLIGGPEGLATAGIAVPLTRNVGFTYAVALPTRGGTTGHIVNLAVQIGPGS